MFLSGLIVSHLHRAPLRLPDPGSSADAPGAWDNKTARRFQGAPCGSRAPHSPHPPPTDFSLNSRGSLTAPAADLEDAKLQASRARLTSEQPWATPRPEEPPSRLF